MKWFVAFTYFRLVFLKFQYFNFKTNIFGIWGKPVQKLPNKKANYISWLKCINKTSYIVCIITVILVLLRVVLTLPLCPPSNRITNIANFRANNDFLRLLKQVIFLSDKNAIWPLKFNAFWQLPHSAFDEPKNVAENDPFSSEKQPVFDLNSFLFYIGIVGEARKWLIIK